MSFSWIERTDEYFRNLKLWDLKIDEAYLNITTALDKVFVYELSSDCHKCPFTKLVTVTNDVPESGVLKISTGESHQFKIFASDHGKYVFDNITTPAICTPSPDLGEFGVYDITVSSDGCKVVTALDPVNTYTPFIVVVALIALFTFAYKGLTHGYRWYVQQHQQDNEVGELDVVQDKKRLKSLDTFRGIAIVLMIFVNSGGGGYFWIEHATWDGLHVADVVFPWFLWIMGVCIPMSVRSALTRNTPPLSVFFNILRRSITLFVIGVCLNSINGPALGNLRIFGVLQRFGIAYFVVSTLMLLFMNPHPVPPQNEYKRAVFDIILLIPQYVAVALIIISYLCIVFLVPVPSCTRGYLGPGGKHDYLSNLLCIGGVTGYVDKLILGESHIYNFPTAKKVYESGSFDPEGILGCMPTVLQVMLGVQAGMILLYHPQPRDRIKRFLCWYAGLAIVSGVLCNFETHDAWIPVNKNLWSLSFVFLTSSLAFLLFTLCFYTVDVAKVWTDDYNPFLYAGMNAIIMYVGHTVMHKMLPWHWRLTRMNTHFLKLLENSWNTILWVLISIFLYNKKIFYSI